MAGPGLRPGVLSRLNTMGFTLPLPFFPPPPTMRRPGPLPHPREVQGEEVIHEGSSVPTSASCPTPTLVWAPGGCMDCILCSLGPPAPVGSICGTGAAEKFITPAMKGPLGWPCP